MFFLGASTCSKCSASTRSRSARFIPLTAIIGILSLGFSAKLNLRFGPKATLVPGLVFVAAGLALISRITADGSYWPKCCPRWCWSGSAPGSPSRR